MDIAGKAALTSHMRGLNCAARQNAKAARARGLILVDEVSWSKNTRSWVEKYTPEFLYMLPTFYVAANPRQGRLSPLIISQAWIPLWAIRTWLDTENGAGVPTPLTQRIEIMRATGAEIQRMIDAGEDLGAWTSAEILEG